MSGPFRAAIVDLDGTLVDTLGDFEQALNATLADLQLPPVSAAFIARTVGQGSEHLIRNTLAEAGAAQDVFDAAWARYQHHYGRVNGQHAEVFPGVHVGLAAMRSAGWRLACLTNKLTAFAQALLASKGLAANFELVFGGDAFARKKPDPLPVTETCRALGLPPAEVLMVGDSRNDAAAATAAGCAVVLLRHGYNHGEPIDEVPALAHLDRLDQLFTTLSGPG